MDIVASHQRLLIAACMRTKGPILELGVGWYSTPLLHEVAESQQRTLITYDNNEQWLQQFKGLESKFHSLRLVGWWGEIFQASYILGRWGLVFVDQAQPIEREYAVRALWDLADVFVLHDTEEGFAYGYDRTLGRTRLSADIRNEKGEPDLGLFKYQWHDRCQRAWTTAASNVIDVTKWGLTELPPVEPTEEIT